MVRNNATEFCEVSSQSDITSMLDSISQKGGAITNSFLQENIMALKENAETTKTKVLSVKNTGLEGGNAE